MSLRLIICTLLFGGVVALAACLYSADPAPAPRPATVGSFSLTDPRDQSVVRVPELKDKKAVVVIFLGCECPINNQFLPELALLHKEYAGRGVQFLGVNSNRQDTPERVAGHARKYKIPFPVLKDPDNRVADEFGARRTPEVFVLGPGGKVLYQGRIDDQFGIGYQRPGKPTRRDLAAALDDVLAGKPVAVAATPVFGCLISRVKPEKSSGAVTFSKQVSRILQERCQDCHRPGQIGPMALEKYEEVSAWADSIREAVAEQRMPPWHADPRHGKFANDRSLSKEEKATLLSWIDQGTPRGDERDLPPPKNWPKDWLIGKPDLVLTMPKPYAVPADAPEGGVPYQYFTIDPGFTEDRWVEQAECRPGAAEVVHHILIFIVPRGEMFRPDGPGNVLVGTAPGDMPLLLAPGLAKKVPAGAKLVFQMHYTPNGKAQSDQSSVALRFAKEKPKHRVLTKPIHNRLFIMRLDRIPAGDPNYKIEASYTFREDAHLVGYMPHMHLRGKDFAYEAVYPDGKTEVLLSVPRYNFAWQNVYRPIDLVRLPKGTKLRCVAHFDNSADNPSNPDPKRNVYWGDQTWEEMMIGWIDYYLDTETP